MAVADDDSAHGGPGAGGATRNLAAARDLASELAVQAGQLQLDRRSSVVVGARKAHANDFVSDVDLDSERLIVDGLSRVWPHDGILAEEENSAPGSTGWRWVIDPLDGTRNYLTGAGPWSVCIALQEGQTTRVAVVHDPAAGETFTAVSGEGALLGDSRLGTSGATKMDEAILGLSFNPSPETKKRVAALVASVLPGVGDLRRVPAALALTYVAAGRFDAAMLIDTKLWDVAAGLLIAAEAGAAVHDESFRGAAVIVAAAPGLWPDVWRLVPEVR
jgi:myo-inositol-1(or 4)-monophosphatase